MPSELGLLYPIKIIGAFGWLEGTVAGASFLLFNDSLESPMDGGFTSGWFKRILAASYSADLAKFEDITAGFFTQAAIWQPGPERRLLEKMIGQIKLALAIQRDENGLLSVALDQISERLAEIEDKSWAAKLERA